MEALQKHGDVDEAEMVETPASRLKTFEEVVAWLHSRNPNMESNHPEEFDWQALKNEGRRY